MPSIWWKSLVAAGVAGYGCGQVYSLMKRHPDTVRPILQCSAVAGIIGAALGLGIAKYRRNPALVYTVSVGANFTVVSATFFGIRHALLEHLPVDSQQPKIADYAASVASGGTTAILAGILSRHSAVSVALTCAAGMLFAAIGQGSYYRFEHWRKQKAIELHYPELVAKTNTTQWTLISFQNWFLGFWHQYSKSGYVEGDIALLEEAMKQERDKIAELDKLLEGKLTAS